jgi:hypothetical protein
MSDKQFNSADFVEVEAYERNGKLVKAHLRHINGGAASPEEVEQFYAEKYASDSSILEGKTKKNEKQYFAHIDKASKRIKKEESDMKKRDARQFTETAYAQLQKEGFSDEDIEEITSLKLRLRESGIGYLDTSEGEDRVLGVVYTGDYRYEEEQGLADIAKSLESGELAPDQIKYEEVNGRGVLSIINISKNYRIQESYERNKKIALKSLDNYTPSEQFNDRLTLSMKKVPELQTLFKNPPAKMPRRKSEIIDALLREKYPNTGAKHPQGEFHDGRVLSIASKNPVMKSMLKKAKAAHDSGNLRVGSSSNPYGRGVLFYDQRDISRKGRERVIRDEEASKAAREYISKTSENLKKNGYLYAIKSNANADTKDIRDSEYFVNYSPQGQKQLFGWFKKDDLEKIARGDLSPVAKKEADRSKRSGDE